MDDLSDSLFNVAMDANEVAIRKRMRKRNLRLDEFVAIKQAQFIRNWREIRELITTRVNVRPKTRQRFFFGDSHTADRVVLFEDQNLQARSGQVAGTRQAIVPRANDDGVIRMRHGQFAGEFFSCSECAECQGARTDGS